MNIPPVVICAEDITKEYIAEWHAKLVWLRDDYLCLKGYERKEPAISILNRAYELKNEMRKEGFKFTY